MTNARVLPAAAAFHFAACASTAPAPKSAPAVTPSANQNIDAVKFRATLEDAYADITARENNAVARPTVDVDEIRQMKG